MAEFIRYSFLAQTDVALGVVRETSAGIIVRGPRVLATLGPLADEIAVYPEVERAAVERLLGEEKLIPRPGNTKTPICTRHASSVRTGDEHILYPRGSVADPGHKGSGTSPGRQAPRAVAMMASRNGGSGWGV